MATFELLRELVELPREKGKKRLMLGLYQASGDGQPVRYLALSEQSRADENSEWISNKRGITVRRGEVDSVIAALKSADFDASPDGRKLSNEEYSKIHVDWS